MAKYSSHFILNNEEYFLLEDILQDLFEHLPEDEQEEANIRLERLGL